jgi:hypothetical protein
MKRPEVDVVVSNDIDEIRSYVEQGWCPVECSIDGESVVDELVMDHHGSLSHLEAVSIRAYRDFYGVRRDDPRFVIAGGADADATFAAAALAGILPHPSRAAELTDAPEQVVARLAADLNPLAETIAVIDTDPIGLDVASMPYGTVTLLWESIVGTGRDHLSACAGVSMWRTLTSASDRRIGPYLRVAHETAAAQREAAREDLDERGVEVGRALVINGSRVFGFDVWYGRDAEAGASGEPAGWNHPVVLSYSEAHGNVTVGCPNAAVAEALFGPGGLKNVLGSLEPVGWGGREAVGGSPRGARLEWPEVEAAARAISAKIVS